MHRLALILCVGSLVACGKGKAGEGPPPAVATTGAIAGQVVEVSGAVTATRGGAARPLAVGDQVHDDDAIATGAGGRIAITLARNEVTWRLGPNMNQVVAQSSAWTAPRADGETAQVSGERSAAAGRHAEREAADTAASAGAPAEPAAAMAPAPSAAAPPAVATADDEAPKAAPRPRRATGGKGGAASDSDDFGGLGLTGTGVGGGGTADGIGLGAVGARGGGAPSGGGAPGGGMPEATSADQDSLANAAPPPPPPPPAPDPIEAPADVKLKATARSAKIVAPPAITLERGALTVTGARPRDQVAPVVAGAQASLARCAIAGDEAAASAVLTFAISADGKVSGAKVTGASTAFATCAAGVVARLSFAAGAEATVQQALAIKR